MGYIRNIVFWVFVGIVALKPSTFLQAQTGPGPSGRFTNPIDYDTLAQFLVALLDVIIQLAFPVIVLAVIYTGFLFVKAQGKPEGLTTAKNALLWTLIGAMLILGAFVLSEAICGTIRDIGGQC